MNTKIQAADHNDLILQQHYRPHEHAHYVYGHEHHEGEINSFKCGGNLLIIPIRPVASNVKCTPYHTVTK